MSSKIKEYTRQINQYIDDIKLVKQPQELYLPVDYCLSNGGKRVRPLMALLACDMFDGNISDVIGPAVGMEIFHNFTLMHDDIMDQAPLRRGKPSVYKKWNANTAILSGDVMFAMAIQHIAMCPEKHLKTILDLFNKTVIEVCEGQQFDMTFESLDKVTEEEYINMIRLKTAVLPAACLKTGAIIAGASSHEAKQLYRFGESVGIAFQIMDDWLDIFGDEESFGKKTGGDIIANKKTWLYIKAFEMADETQLRDLRNAFTNRIYNPEEKISIVKNVYLKLKLDQLALKKMEEFNKKAYGHLNKIELPEEKKKDLKTLAEKLIDRKI
ncbi:MAG: polyprenyl synthetase family protein [Bacteroidetes bacterium]|nr:MAG: polyprenyl synthetase family protein [Bacteroidota bacterium]